MNKQRVGDVPSVSEQRGGRPSRRKLVYEALRRDLMNGIYAPWDRLGEEKIAASYGVSRTPVREALARLQSDGLIQKRGGGLYLSLPSFEELVDLYELRVTLESQGIQRVIDDPTLHHAIETLENEREFWRGCLDERPALDPAFVTCDERFHVTLLDAAGNPALTEALVQVNHRIRPVRMNDYVTEDRMEVTITEHLGILDLVLSDRLQEALGALRAHVGSSRDVVMERAARALSMMGVRAQ